MIASKTFGLPVEERLFESVISILKKNYGLVDGKGMPQAGDFRVLVWEDEMGVGRYRVHCYCNEDWKIPNDGRRYDVFVFHYWFNPEKFDREIFSRDQMREPLQSILALSENRFETDDRLIEATVDEIEEEVLRKAR